jgi:hypothetical protein
MSEYEVEFSEDVIDGSEQLDQIAEGDSLLDRGVADSLDEGYVSADRWSAAEGYGNTASEMRRGETIDMRLAQEEPEEPDDYDQDYDWVDEPGQSGRIRAGRIVAPDTVGGDDVESESVAFDYGISGGASTAEEAAMYVLDDPEDDVDDYSGDFEAEEVTEQQ